MSGEPPGIKAGGRSMTSRRFCVWRTASLQNGQQQKSSSTDELSMSVWIVGIRMIFGRGSPGEGWLHAQKALWGDARRENLPPGGVITLSERPLHICQQNYKNEGRGKNPSPCFHALRRCLVKAGSHVAARSSCGTARGFFPPARRETA